MTQQLAAPGSSQLTIPGTDRPWPMPSWAQPLYFENYTFNIFAGGRNSGKSYTVADYLIYISLITEDASIVCAREFQKSIRTSVHLILSRQIKRYGLQRYFKITDTTITALPTDTTFTFEGLWRNHENVKSTPNLKYLWLEEASNVSKASWVNIIPTLTRNQDCKIICTFNPYYETDLVYRTFFIDEPLPNSYITKLTYRDNPYPIPASEIAQMSHKKRTEYEEYLHVYEGHFKRQSDAQIFKGRWRVEDFDEPKNVHKYFGLDFGFSLSDPTAGIRCYILDNVLYISHEAVKKQIDIDEIGKFLEERLPDLNSHTIYADNSGTGVIAFIKKQGYRVKAVEKGKGTIEGGIAYIKTFDQIVIHPRCVETIKEFTLYSYKVDERSGDITNIIEDKNNHTIDALRYALERCMKKKGIDYSKWNI